eukprot:jgi/Botrbrau1/14526/Bobra.0223s0015.1
MGVCINIYTHLAAHAQRLYPLRSVLQAQPIGLARMQPKPYEPFLFMLKGSVRPFRYSASKNEENEGRYINMETIGPCKGPWRRPGFPGAHQQSRKTAAYTHACAHSVEASP